MFDSGRGFKTSGVGSTGSRRRGLEGSTTGRSGVGRPPSSWGWSGEETGVSLGGLVLTAVWRVQQLFVPDPVSWPPGVFRVPGAAGAQPWAVPCNRGGLAGHRCKACGGVEWIHSPVTITPLKSQFIQWLSVGLRGSCSIPEVAVGMSWVEVHSARDGQW